MKDRDLARQEIMDLLGIKDRKNFMDGYHWCPGNLCDALRGRIPFSIRFPMSSTPLGSNAHEVVDSEGVTDIRKSAKKDFTTPKGVAAKPKPRYMEKAAPFALNSREAMVGNGYSTCLGIFPDTSDTQVTWKTVQRPWRT